MAYELWKAGVPLMAGSDSPEFFLVQGFSLHDELEMFVKAGLSPLLHCKQQQLIQLLIWELIAEKELLKQEKKLTYYYWIKILWKISEIREVSIQCLKGKRYMIRKLCRKCWKKQKHWGEINNILVYY